MFHIVNPTDDAANKRCLQLSLDLAQISLTSTAAVELSLSIKISAPPQNLPQPPDRLYISSVSGNSTQPTALRHVLEGSLHCVRPARQRCRRDNSSPGSASGKIR
jgi:hypothetical protein